MPTEIRVLQADDCAVLDNVAPGVLDDPLDRAATLTFRNDPRHHLAVAIDGNVVVGFVSAVHYVHPIRTSPP